MPDFDLTRYPAVLALTAALPYFLVSCNGPVSQDTEPQIADILFENGRVIQGGDLPPLVADVAVTGDRIVAVGSLDHYIAAETLDAAGLIIAPGFIDIHSHADDHRGARRGLRSPDPARRQALNVVTQGITTVVVNPDGFGDPELTIAEQRMLLESGGTGVNVALMAAHNAIRFAVMQDDHERKATSEELARMKVRVGQAMREGAYGLTSGLEYAPGRWSDRHELIELAREIEPYDGVYISHIRSETSAPMWWVPSQDADNPPQLVDGINEVIAVAEGAGVRSVATHMKVRGTTHRGQSDVVIRMIEDARSRGLPVYGDQYPYDSSGSDGRIVLIPNWALGRPQDAEAVDDSRNWAEALEATLEEPGRRAALIDDIEHAIEFRGGARNIVVFDHPDPSLVGRNLEDLSRQREVTPAEFVLILQFEGYERRPGGARLRSFSLANADIERLMSRPWVATSTDGGVSLPADGPAVHPRYYGAFPRKIARYVRDKATISLEFAIRAATALPAKIMNFTDRGELAPGYAADVVVFALDDIEDTATFSEPHQYARGIRHVLVNGQFVVRDGIPTGALPGRVLIRGDGSKTGVDD